MKTIKHVVVIGILIGSCDFMIDSVNERSQSELKAEYTKNVIDKVNSWESCCTINNALVREIEDWKQRKNNLQYIPAIFDQTVRSDWKEVHIDLSTQLDEIIDQKLTEKERLSTVSIQYFILKFMDRYLVSQNPSGELADVTMYYLKILIRHQAVELKVMSEALINIKNVSERSDYMNVREYLIHTALARQQYASDNIGNYVTAINESKSAKDKNEWYSHAKGLENQSMESQYVLELLRE